MAAVGGVPKAEKSQASDSENEFDDRAEFVEERKPKKRLRREVEDEITIKEEIASKAKDVSMERAKSSASENEDDLF